MNNSPLLLFRILIFVLFSQVVHNLLSERIMVRTKQSARKAKAGGIFSAFGNLDRRSEGEEVGPSYEDTYDTLQEVRLEKLYNFMRFI